MGSTSTQGYVQSCKQSQPIITARQFGKPAPASSALRVIPMCRGTARLVSPKADCRPAGRDRGVFGFQTSAKEKSMSYAVSAMQAITVDRKAQALIFLGAISPWRFPTLRMSAGMRSLDLGSANIGTNVISRQFAGRRNPSFFHALALTGTGQPIADRNPSRRGFDFEGASSSGKLAASSQSCDPNRPLSPMARAHSQHGNVPCST